MPDYVIYLENGTIVSKLQSVDPSQIKGEERCLQVDREVLQSITKYHLVDSGAVREMTQVEKDALDLAEQQAQEQVENNRVIGLDNEIENGILQGMTLAKIDTAINNIGSLADAKVFLKKMCRYIIKFIA
jgi:hypothetical protein